MENDNYTSDSCFLRQIDELISKGFSYEKAVERAYKNEITFTPSVNSKETLECEKMVFDLLERRAA